MPVIPECSVQWYWNLPVFLNRIATLSPGAKTLFFSPLSLTVWSWLPSFVHLTFSPWPILTFLGSKKSSYAETAIGALAEPEAPPVTIAAPRAASAAAAIRTRMRVFPAIGSER